MHKPTFTGRVGLVSIGAAALLVGLTAGSAQARLAGHPEYFPGGSLAKTEF